MKITGTAELGDDEPITYDLEITFSPDEWRNLFAGLALATHLNDGSPDRAADYARGMANALIEIL